jgi:hypothetical protein
VVDFVTEYRQALQKQDEEGLLVPNGFSIQGITTYEDVIEKIMDR